jgi:hypothetical protein
MRIIITEEQSKKLFIPRNINKRYSDWNKDQPDITINGHLYRFNQYDINGKKIGLWLNDPTSIIANYNKTKEFLSEIFDKLELKGRYYKIGNKLYPEQDLKYGDIWVDYDKIWIILRGQYLLNYVQVEDIIRVWMEEKYKLGSLTPCQLLNQI